MFLDRYKLQRCESIQDTRWGAVLSLCRDAVSVFYSPSRLDRKTFIGGVLFLCRDAVSDFYNPKRQDHKTLMGGVLLLCGDALGVFYKAPVYLGFGIFD